ncbi:MAG: IS110 family transposase [Candidatus Krumholzibacteria bacterium]|nr:IS110 family transposase [Candidatus Krumholzibacteria bacterium]
MIGKLFVGLDLGQRFHQVAVINAAMELVVEPFRIKRGREGIEALMGRVKGQGAGPEDVVVTIEATANYWNDLVWVLVSRGCRVYLAHPKKAHDLRKFYAVHTKTDVKDSEALARMPLVDEGLRPVWVATPAQQMLLRLCRLRWKCRCRIADLKRRISTFSEMVVPGIDRVMPVRYSKSARLFQRRYLAPQKARRVGKRRLVEILSKAAWGKFSEKKSEALWQCVENAPDLGWNPDDLLLEASVQLDELEALECQVERLDARIAELYTEIDPNQRLKQIPGLGEFLSAALTAHIGDVSRFPNTKALISYAGLAPRVKESAGHTKPGQGITKHGSPYLRAWAYLGAACARQYDPELKAYYERMRARGKHYNVALCATAARLLERTYDVLSERREEETESQDQLVGTG